MSVSGHKSLESLAIYQKVANDEKMMMGMALTYSLLRANDVLKVINPIPPSAVVPANQIQPTANITAPQIVTTVSTPDMIPIQSTTSPATPVTKEIQPVPQQNATETALVPVSSTDTSMTDFNLVDILKEFKDMDEDNNLLVKATHEAEMTTNFQTSTTTASLVRRHGHAPTPNFVNCKISNININIYKN